MQKDAEKQKAEQAVKDMEASILKKKIDEQTPNAAAGEAAILKDDAAITIFADLLAK
jgi:hypothetical protein